MWIPCFFCTAGKGLQFSGIPSVSDVVVTAVNAGGNPNLYRVGAAVAGTVFGASTPQAALPASLKLVKEGNALLYSAVHVVAALKFVGEEV